MSGTIVAEMQAFLRDDTLRTILQSHITGEWTEDELVGALLSRGRAIAHALSESLDQECFELGIQLLEVEAVRGCIVFERMNLTVV